jgi:uncharacterized protein (TIGR00251 family)
MNHWIVPHPQGVLIRVHAQPKASKSEISGIYEGAEGEPQRLKIRIAAPPVDGEANEELLRFLKKRLRLPGVRLELLRGDSSRLKDVLCCGAELEKVKKALLETGSK